MGILKPCVGVFTLNKPPGFLKFHRTSKYKIETGAQQPLFGVQMGAIRLPFYTFYHWISENS